MPVIAAAALAGAVLTRPEPARKTPAAVDASVLRALDAEFNALKKLEREYNDSLLEIELAAPASGGAARKRAAALKEEWLAFSDGIHRRTAAVEAILKENSLDETERKYFRLRADYSAERDKALLRADSDLKLAFNSASESGPAPILKEDKLALLRVSLNLKVLTRDEFAMPDYRLADLTAREETMKNELDARERKFMEKIREGFRRESDGISGRLENERRALEDELELAVSEALSEAERSLAAAEGEQRMVSETAVAEGAKRRRGMSASGRVEKTDSQGMESPPQDFGEIEALLQTEFMRRLARKAPAVAERNGNGIVFNTVYPDAGKAENTTEKFREAMGL